MQANKQFMSSRDRFFKRLFDIIVSFIGLLLLWWFILMTFILATLDTRRNGFFTQRRVGKDGKLFTVIKIRTMREMPNINTAVTHENDPRITCLGRFWRRSKIDELPQLVNVLFGQMSLVGPRPDVPGFADQLTAPDEVILSVRPGITGPATLYFRNEEKLLARQMFPETYNKEIIWPEKVRMNREYVENYSFWRDLQYIWQTIFG